jgi:hypothetical protein
MAFRDDIANDLSEVMDNLETITVTLMNRTGGPETVTVEAANRSAMGRKNNSLGGAQIEEDDLRFTFETNNFVPVTNAAEIRRLDLVTDADGVVYIVQDAKLLTLQTRWQVAVRLKG